MFSENIARVIAKIMLPRSHLTLPRQARDFQPKGRTATETAGGVQLPAMFIPLGAGLA